MPSTREDELVRILRGQDTLMQEVYSILEEEEKRDDILQALILSDRRHHENRITGLDPSRIFQSEDIRRVCISYRLRFLPAGCFKGSIPYGALHAVRHLEARSGAPLSGFKVMAPAKRFKLCDCDADPLLFVPLGADSYYLVHRWGRELTPVRAVLSWPVRTPGHLIATVLLAAALLACLMPTSWLASDPTTGWFGAHRIGAFFTLTLMAGATTAFGWFAFFGQFSEDAWDSSTFN